MEFVKAVKTAMPTALKKAIRKAVLPAKAGRGLTVREHDIFLVSYPKSGNTWTRFLLGNLFHHGDEITFANVERKVPDIYQNTDRAMLGMTGPRLIKSHEYFDPRYRGVIYIVRDPRDVAVSYYHYLIKVRAFDEGYPMELFVRRFLQGEWDRFGSWGENVGSWLGARGTSNSFLLLRYEDLLGDAKKELRKAATFLGLQVSDAQIHHAIESGSFERMRELEKAQAREWHVIRSSRSDKPFVRTGKSGGWRAELEQATAELIAREWSELMAELKYETA